MSLKLFSINECSKLFGLPGRTISGWIRDGYVKATKSPSKKIKRYFIRREDLIRLAEQMAIPDVVKAIKEHK